MLRNQESEFLKAFSYWPIPTAREGNNIYDVRSYELKPGSMYDWGNYWSKGINCRKNVRDDIPYVCLFPKYLILATDHPFKTSACSRGGGIQNLRNLPTVGGRGQKSVKNCRRLKWMVPKEKQSPKELKK